MPGHRFFISPKNYSLSNALITGDEARHLQKVLRLRVGEEIRVFDGVGFDYTAVIEEFRGKDVYLKLIQPFEEKVESPLQITLAQGLIKGERFEWVIQKAVELGVSTIQPLITAHTDIKPAKGQIDNRLERWERIALEATKQSGRSLLTKILPPKLFFNWLKEQDLPGIFFLESGGKPLSQTINTLKKEPVDKITLVVGSEGGWSENEVLEVSQKGFYIATLGKRILRAETAGVTAVSLIQHLLGDLD